MPRSIDYKFIQDTNSAIAKYLVEVYGHITEQTVYDLLNFLHLVAHNEVK